MKRYRIVSLFLIPGTSNFLDHVHVNLEQLQ